MLTWQPPPDALGQPMRLHARRRAAPQPRFALRCATPKRRSHQQAHQDRGGFHASLLISDVQTLRTRWAACQRQTPWVRHAHPSRLQLFARAEVDRLAAEGVTISPQTVREVVTGASWAWVPPREAI